MTKQLIPFEKTKNAPDTHIILDRRTWITTHLISVTAVNVLSIHWRPYKNNCESTGRKYFINNFNTITNLIALNRIACKTQSMCDHCERETHFMFIRRMNDDNVKRNIHPNYLNIVCSNVSRSNAIALFQFCFIRISFNFNSTAICIVGSMNCYYRRCYKNLNLLIVKLLMGMFSGQRTANVLSMKQSLNAIQRAIDETV